jgi:glutamine amidotransferase
MIKPIILNIDSGNILSLKNIIQQFSDKLKVTNLEEDITSATHIFLPGVGSYSEVMKKLNQKINLKLLKKQVFEKKIYLLGICVGMQILSDFGYENEKYSGLSYINGKVKKLSTKEILPHVGWNSINFNNKNKILNKIPNKTDFYFTHSYAFNVNKSNNEIANTNYGINFSSIINQDNIYGTQFHPEKSQSAGVILIKNFLDLK